MVEDFNWTAPLDQIDFRPDVLGMVDALEVYGCVRVLPDFAGYAVYEPAGDDEEPDIWSTYFHRPGEGASCIADRNTMQEAIDYASAWGFALRVPVYIYGSAE